MEEGYGQFCTVARAAEALCERWTPLVIRELLNGSKRFNDLRRGVPRMSTSLLVQRLRRLEDLGVVRHSAVGKVSEYSLTKAARNCGLSSWRSAIGARAGSEVPCAKASWMRDC